MTAKTLRPRALATESAEQLLAGFGRNDRRFFITKGLCSTIDVLDALLRLTGPVQCDLAFWTIGKKDLERVDEWVGLGRFTRLRFLLGSSYFMKHADYGRYLLERFGARHVRLAETHAKFATLHGDGWNVSLRTSANLNRNVQYEWLEVEDHAGICEFLRGFLDAEFAQPPNVDATLQEVRKRFSKRKLEDGTGPSRDLNWAESDKPKWPETPGWKF